MEASTPPIANPHAPGDESSRSKEPQGQARGGEQGASGIEASETPAAATASPAALLLSPVQTTPIKPPLPPRSTRLALPAAGIGTPAAAPASPTTLSSASLYPAIKPNLLHPRRGREGRLSFAAYAEAVLPGWGAAAGGGGHPATAAAIAIFKAMLSGGPLPAAAGSTPAFAAEAAGGRPTGLSPPPPLRAPLPGGPLPLGRQPSAGNHDSFVSLRSSEVLPEAQPVAMAAATGGSEGGAAGAATEQLPVSKCPGGGPADRPAATAEVLQLQQEGQHPTGRAVSSMPGDSTVQGGNDTKEPGDDREEEMDEEALIQGALGAFDMLRAAAACGGGGGDSPVGGALPSAPATFGSRPQRMRQEPAWMSTAGYDLGFKLSAPERPPSATGRRTPKLPPAGSVLSLAPGGAAGAGTAGGAATPQRSGRSSRSGPSARRRGGEAARPASALRHGWVMSVCVGGGWGGEGEGGPYAGSL